MGCPDFAEPELTSDTESTTEPDGPLDSDWLWAGIASRIELTDGYALAAASGR